jgi:hypothetical protein
MGVWLCLLMVFGERFGHGFFLVSECFGYFFTLLDTSVLYHIFFRKCYCVTTVLFSRTLDECECNVDGSKRRSK